MIALIIHNRNMLKFTSPCPNPLPPVEGEFHNEYNYIRLLS